MARILCVADTQVDRTSGYGIRLLHVIQGLAELGEVDLVTIEHTDEHDPRAAPPPHVARHLALARYTDRSGVLIDAIRWYRSGLPRRVLWQDWGQAIGELRGWMRDTYDLVWLSHADTAALVRTAIPDVPLIIDFDNLENEKLRRRREAHAYRLDHGGWRRHPARVVSVVVDQIDTRRWQKLQRELASASDHVAVCSELDRGRLGLGERAAIVPNGYDEFPVRAHDRQGDHPIMTFIGLLTYEPNADAASFLAEDVLPRVQARHPDVELRLVGRYPGTLAPLGELPGVTLVGFVDEIGDELAKADVVVAPIRFGSGTRVKLLEAFAGMVPAVTTTIGCEGLEARHDVHLLVADDAAGLAGAVCRVLESPTLGRRLTRAAHQLWRTSYTGSHVRHAVSQLAADTIETRQCRSAQRPSR